MNKYEIAVSRFANDLSVGALVPNDGPDDEGLFFWNSEQYTKDVELLQKLEYLFRTGHSHIIIDKED